MTSPTTTSGLRIRIDRLERHLHELGRVGALEGGGVCRLALTDADRAGRDLVAGWMRELGLRVTVDRIGNVLGVRAGAEDGPPVLMGSHVDTVRTGGLYDGNLGVLAGLEVVQTLEDAGVSTRHPVAVALFTNEEGSRFQPDMMGSAVHQGSLALEEALDAVGIDGARVGAELERIGYAGDAPCPGAPAAGFLELHIEQGPVLDREQVTIGAVTGVQGISWTEWTIEGVSNHAGTTPMSLRSDAGYVACCIAAYVRELAMELGGDQVATVGSLALQPNLVNVVANRAVLTVDLRNTDDAILRQAEERTAQFIERFCGLEGTRASARSLARFAPVEFDPAVVEAVERTARGLGASVKRLPSGAGHDAQMFAPNCPSGMIFVPSVDGISHNVTERTELADIEVGANVLLHVLLERAGEARGA